MSRKCTFIDDVIIDDNLIKVVSESVSIADLMRKLGHPESISGRKIVQMRKKLADNGIDTPEIRGKCAKEKQLAKDAKFVLSRTLIASKRIDLKNVDRGKYFRIVADVYADGVNVSDELLELGLAVPYDGGKKTKDWCE